MSTNKLHPTEIRRMQRESQRQAAMREARKAHPHLIAEGDSKQTGPTLAAANIRRTLKRLYAGTKFSVRTSKYSGGSSVNVSWTGGPTPTEVERHIGGHAAGRFNGMIDLYEPHEDVDDAAFGAVFGSTHYVFVSRHLPPDMLDAVRAAIRERSGKASWETPLAYDQRVSSEAEQALRATRIPDGAKVERVELADDPDRRATWRIVFSNAGR